MQDVTAEMIEEVFSQTSREQALLIKLEAEGLDDPLYVTNRPQGLVSNPDGAGAVEYRHFPFNFTWAGASEGKPTKEAKVEIANCDQEILRAVRAATGRPRMTVYLVRVSAPNAVELALTGAWVYDVDATGPSVTATLRPRNFATEPACSKRYTAFRTPGLF